MLLLNYFKTEKLLLSSRFFPLLRSPYLPPLTCILSARTYSLWSDILSFRKLHIPRTVLCLANCEHAGDRSLLGSSQTGPVAFKYIPKFWSFASKTMEIPEAFLPLIFQWELKLLMSSLFPTIFVKYFHLSTEMWYIVLLTSPRNLLHLDHKGHKKLIYVDTDKSIQT